MPTLSNDRHLAHIIALLGPRSPDILKQGQEISTYFDGEGTQFNVTSFCKFSRLLMIDSRTRP
ncbi:hypothetical protein V1525DRAFT_79889 [Lipomyces kononenkoae]|uniref:Uncharacterized protein n=1 Tax=Lipomyces kononenkoae TaxID=34357 RepID=A0ACC3T4B3_LIPKO